MHHQRTPQPAPGDVRAYSVMHTVRALELLAREPQSAPQLAAHLGTADRTARRLLQRLALEGWVVQEGGRRRRYHPTLRLALVGRSAVEGASWAATAGGVVAALAAASGCTAHLWVVSQGGPVCVVHAEADGDPRSAPTPWLGERAPADSSAAHVLGPSRSTIRSTTFLDADGAPSAACAIRTGTTVVGALGVSGPRAGQALVHVDRAARALTTAPPS